MSDKYFEYGEVSDQLIYPEGQQLFEACQEFLWIQIVECRSLKRNDGDIEDIIIIDLGDGSVPSRNGYGVFAKERLAITYRPLLAAYRCPYDVRAIRKAFPLTSHRNHVDKNEPKSLCLYFEPWSALERTWTPQQHLKRILWWLKETAQGTLHRADQPLEPLYFTSPWQIILPHDFHTKVEDRNTSLLLHRVEVPQQSAGSTVLLGELLSHNQQQGQQQSNFECLVVLCPPVSTGFIEAYPYTVKELNDQLFGKGLNIYELLHQAVIRKIPDGTGLDVKQSMRNPLTFILLHVPVIREETNEIERFDKVGFFTESTFIELGNAVGALSVCPDNRDKIYKNYAGALGGLIEIDTDFLQQAFLMPVETKLRITHDYARQASGIVDDLTEFKGVIAGVGALGGCLAGIWSKEAWGCWTYIDDDTLQPHNIIRHVGKDCHIGQPKAELVKNLTSWDFDTGLVKNHAVVAKINDANNQEAVNALKEAELIVDVTTTLEVPRDLSRRVETPRMASVFVSPSGRDSVMLLEDKERSVNLGILETQYYRAVLSSEWGGSHLVGHLGDLWVGAGCRDVSSIMSYELIQLHSAILARQIRQQVRSEAAKIKIWVNDDTSGNVTAVDIAVHPGCIQQCGSWAVCWDQGLQEKLSDMRRQRLPNETGGVLLGYLDQKTRSIHLVDALPAPADSTESASEFLRGTNGLQGILDECQRRTANIVRYVGEWHSHPPDISTNPSCVDIELLAFLAEQMSAEGLPAVMGIIGDFEPSFSVGQKV